MERETLAACILCGDPGIEAADRENDLGRCRACGLVFENPRPTQQAIIDFYSRPGQYGEWLEAEGARDRLWKRRLAKLEAHRKPGSLLDIGTGIGQFLAVAKARYAEVAGTEVSTGAIAIAREKFALEILHGQAEDLDFRGRTFDNITLFHVLEHVLSPKRLLEKCRDLLAPGGVLTIAVPNDIASLGAVKRRLQARLGSGPGGPRGAYGLPRLTLDGSLDEIHLSHFTEPVLSRYLAGAGFAILDSSLDPFYACAGSRLLKMHGLYRAFSLVKRITGVNLYGTLWISARKNPHIPGAGV
jgi:SAM-dependent methyltransferase